MATTVEPEPPVRLADLTAHPVEPGDETTVDATLENLVDEVVSGEVSIALPDEWGGDESDSYELGPNAEQTVSLSVTAPDDAERDADTAHSSLPEIPQIL